MSAPWLKWAFLEALAKTISKGFQKVVGVTSVTLAHAIYATFLIGIVQTLFGLTVAHFQKKMLLDNPTHVLGSIAFGTLAFLCTVLGFYVFMINGEVGVSTFIISLSIIPGALIDRIVFKHKLSARQWLGVGVAILSFYVVLGAPSLKEAANLPLWIWLSGLIAIAGAVNQGITQKIKGVDPMVKNFWGGLTTVILSVGTATLLTTDSLTASTDMVKLTWVSLLIGIIVVGMWSFNLLSYKDGAYITLKKMVTMGGYMIMAMFLGMILFDEQFSALKIVGVFIYLAAFTMIDQGTWNGLFGKKAKEAPST